MAKGKNNLEKLKKKLVIVEEYKKPEIFPISYITADSFINLQKAKSTRDDKRLESEEYQYTIDNPHFQFNRQRLLSHSDIVRKEEGGYIFLPTNTHYHNLVELVQGLADQLPLKSIFSALSWQEFEQYLVDLLESVDFFTHRTFRFAVNKHRYEIDCLARKYFDILCIDAKRWRNKTISPSKLINALYKQHERLSELVSNTEISEEFLHILQVKKNEGMKYELDSPIMKKVKLSGGEKKNHYRLYPIILVSHKIPEIIIKQEGFILDFSHFNDLIVNFRQYASKIKPIVFSFD